jgi:hypothetical protein
MSDDRYMIRKGRTGEHWAGTWQVWEITYAAPGIQRLERMMSVWKTHEDAVSWLHQHLKQVKHFIHTGEWHMS